jgi:hypothetical protein
MKYIKNNAKTWVNIDKSPIYFSIGNNFAGKHLCCPSYNFGIVATKSSVLITQFFLSHPRYFKAKSYNEGTEFQIE